MRLPWCRREQQTHNLEVPGSSPGWSTLLLQRLMLRRRPLFFDFCVNSVNKLFELEMFTL